MALKLYLVRWESGDTEIVSAHDEMDLFDTLDEVGDPYCAYWRPFRERIWVMLYIDPEGGYAREGFRPGEEDPIVYCDTREEMSEEILKHAFPTLHAKREAFYENDGDEPDEEELACWEVARKAELAYPPTGKGWKTFDTPEMRARIKAYFYPKTDETKAPTA